MTFIKSLQRRTGGHVDLFYCMTCQSASSPLSPPVPEGDDTNWHLSVRERNMEWGRELFRTLGNEGPYLDIGCGIGTLVQTAQGLGMKAIGFDTNAHACSLGRERYGLDLRAEYWRRETSPPAKLITCISVLEHLHEPREMIADLVGAALEVNSKLFISVPFFNEHRWRDLLTDNLQPGHFFEVPHAHVTHFSPKGLEMVCREFGAKNVEYIRIANAWHGLLI